jgi:hypothetical protein
LLPITTARLGKSANARSFLSSDSFYKGEEALSFDVISCLRIMATNLKVSKLRILESIYEKLEGGRASSITYA